MKTEPSGWLVWSATGALWICFIAIWLYIFTSLGMGFAEFYGIQVGSLSPDYYEARR